MTIATLAEPTTTGGLTSQQAEQRFAEIGPNDPVPRRQHSALRELLQLFLNPLVLILLIASAASTFSGQFVDGGIIAVILLLSIALDFFQTYRSQNAIEQLRKRVTPTATVLRDGEWKETPQREVVPGDWVRLSAGDLVPADAILLESHDLFVQQSALTGESLPAEKEAGSKTPSKDAETRHMVFLGTSVISGSATAQVVETGVRTGFGGIAARLQSRHTETAFDRGLREFSLFLARTVLFLVVFLIAVSIALHRDPLQSILFAVALAVGLTPEFLPMITSITLAKGAIAMARKSVIVKHLSAIQNLGSVDILCTDKTGTLTTGVMSLESSLDPLGKPSERALALAFINSKFETGIRSPLDETILRSRSFNSDGYTKYDEIPFDFERRRLSIVVDHADGRILIAKGAPEGIFPQLNSYEIEGRVESFKDEDLAKFKDTCNALSKQGYRVIAVAYAHVENKER